mmetsp:Transcript_27869/g.75322  ORF Transcript_27869/g.75322 Transcript_27869/m.75322 type:complete len:95 (-) Transcript_27869:1203-1487(-)
MYSSDAPCPCDTGLARPLHVFEAYIAQALLVLPSVPVHGTMAHMCDVRRRHLNRVEAERQPCKAAAKRCEARGDAVLLRVQQPSVNDRLASTAM